MLDAFEIDAMSSPEYGLEHAQPTFGLVNFEEGSLDTASGETTTNLLSLHLSPVAYTNKDTWKPHHVHQYDNSMKALQAYIDIKDKTDKGQAYMPKLLEKMD